MEKKDTLKNVLIIVLILAVVGLSSACLYLTFNNSNNSSDSDNNNNNQNGGEQVDVIKTENLEGTEKNKLLNEVIPVLDRSPFTVTTYSKDTITNEQKIKFAITAHNQPGTNVSSQTLLSLAKKYLGETGEFQPQDIGGCTICGNLWYKYDAATSMFNSKLSEHAHGGGDSEEVNGIRQPINHFVSGTVTKENGNIKTVELKLRKSFAESGDVVFAGNRYGTYKGTDRITLTDFSDEAILKHIEDNPSMYPIHTYTFEYNNGNYNLTSIVVE